MTNYDRAKQLVLVMLKGSSAPTTDEIRNRIKMVADMLKLDTGESGFDENQLYTEIESLMNVWIGLGSTLDDETDHIPWLADRRSEIKWRFWGRYERFLEEDAGWPPATTERLGQLSDAVLERLENPQRPGKWDRRGMVVGNVQSGKTANYIGLVCKAVDAGYKLIIILAGLHNSLRSQTQIRFDEGFLGFDTKRNRAFNDQNIKIGVGKILASEYPVAHSLTSSADNGDFKKAIARTIGVVPGGNDPVLLVVKKNKTILKHLYDWIIAMRGERENKKDNWIIRNVPLLLIDDEADNASVNTNPIPVDDKNKPLPDYDVTAINGAIRALLKAFEKSAYVGYTATPFANIFIYPEGETETHGEDLFPRSFIINLPAPDNYIGPATVFGIDASPESGIDEGMEALPLFQPIDDYQEWIPDKHKKGHIPGATPGTLKKAIQSFILACAARAARNQKNKHNSMLIHVSRFTDVQKAIFDSVTEELKNLRRRLEYGDGRGASLLNELEKLWIDDFVPVTDYISKNTSATGITKLDWKSVKEQLPAAAAKIKVKVINGSAKDTLDYMENVNGLSVIAIGGDKLSRGLTLEGLAVSYFLRASKMYDTLMQMGRWFGYRPGYLDLCRLYMTKELAKWYREITFASEELRREFDHMAAVGGTPSDYGLKVRTHPEGLLITSVNKMRSGTIMKVSYSGHISESVAFDSSASVIRKNYERAAQLITDMNSFKAFERERNNYVWIGIGGGKVQSFLADIKTHRESWKANGELLSRYIQKKIGENELTSWTVALISKSASGDVDMGGVLVDPIIRELRESEDKLSIRRLVSPVDEMIDFDNPRKEEALQKTIDNWKQNPGRRKKQPSMPSGIVIREMRNPKNGLLLLYPIKPAEDGGSDPLMGFAVSFPCGETPTTIEYKVNNIYWEQEFGNT